MTTETKPAVTKLIYHADELAFVLGVNVRTIWRYNSAGTIPRALRIGGSLVWRIAEIGRWMEAGCPDRKKWETMEFVRVENPKRQ